MATRIIMNTPVSIDPSNKPGCLAKVSIKLPIFGLKFFDISRDDVAWVVAEGQKLLAVKK